MAKNTENTLLSLAKDLMARQSVTPNDAGCQAVLISRLEALGFSIESMVFEDTTNFWARRGTNAPLFAFAGHTDVVPSGPIEQWDSPPFEPSERDGFLFGRGAADMKGSLAAMVVAVERFVHAYPNHPGSLAFLITSDEEGPFINGTPRVVETLMARDERIDMCLVGEPSSSEEVGDVVKNGRRGSLTGDLLIKGIQGHVAYPHLARNPIQEALPALLELNAIKWDNGNAFFPPTSLQIVNINAGVGASNVIPGELNVQFNLRFSSELNHEDIQAKIEALLDKHALEHTLKWTLSGQPFLTPDGPLLDAAVKVIEEMRGTPPALLTTGGTSDGRFIAQMGAQVIELGPVNNTIHKANECVKINDLTILTDMYHNILKAVLTV